MSSIIGSRVRSYTATAYMAFGSLAVLLILAVGALSRAPSGTLPKSYKYAPQLPCHPLT
jgi:hypothetical protein